MTRPVADFQARQRFACELNRNFSVIASAGSGKTRAISDRVTQIAKHQHAREWLPQLVVVTYTNRAADEMQQRTRQQILEAALPLEVVEAFNRAFFGTIHSFCVKLLATYGHHLGLPANLELVTDDDDLWNEFVQQHTTIGRSLSAENRRALLRHMPVRQVMELARRNDVDLTSAKQPEGPCPGCDFGEVYKAVSRRATNIPKAKELLREWERRWRESDEFVPWPPCATSAREFVHRWREAFRPLREWMNACALCVAAEVQRDYRDFRLERGAATYTDQVALAAELLRLPEVARRIREKNYRVIVDEAQDTDPQQFFVLLEIVRPPEAAGIWMEKVTARRAVATESGAPPRAGHFCMVGDFQQSIYRNPRELAHYRELHESLVKTGAAEELKFSVTFRLDQAQLDFVNATFANILNNTDGQVEFVELSPRPDVLPGQVIRFELGSEIDLQLSEIERAAIEAQQLAEWIRATGLKGLRARSWSQVAMLCPRKAWLLLLRDALLDADLPVEVHSESEREAEHPAYAWLTALLAIMVDPHASYEVVGVLREVFGISDDELARFAQGDGTKFQIAERTRSRGVVADALNNLFRLRDALSGQPLFTAVQEIVRVTQLRERLRSLPPSEFGDTTAELERLVSIAAAAETRKSSLADFAETLQRKFHAIRDTHPSTADAIQLITAHKAKGSEWDAVIVPFLAREVGLAATNYPRIVQTEPAQIALDAADWEQFKDETKRIQRQEMERLLYVAITRARHTLVLALDQEFFRGARGQVHTDTQLKWLQADVGEANAEVVSAIAVVAEACAETELRQSDMPGEKVHDSLSTLRLETGWIDIARQKSAVFIEIMSPSKFSSEEELETIESADIWIEIEPELRPPRIENPATRYGVWWHEFVQQIPLFDDASWEKIFTASVISSPDPARSKREWELLKKHLASSSDFRRRINRTVVHSEMPFLWRLNESMSLEGIVDLALFNGDKAMILDWKTNRIAPDRIDNLRTLYRPQIAAYWKAVTEMSGTTVAAGIYSTSIGEFIDYDSDELAAEWERIRSLWQPISSAELAAT
ncbi:MAG TPA: UvrD-helicase domain-containing protein [Chthoniobacterales bacterium]|nr:UvrD-helicase domain-containing protein [Chthoniobacterales bacterium]